MYLHDSLFTFTTFFLSGFWLCGFFYNRSSDRVILGAFIASAMLTAVSWRLSLTLTVLIPAALFVALLLYIYLKSRQQVRLLLLFSLAFLLGILLYLITGKPTSRPSIWWGFDLLLAVYGAYICLVAYLVAWAIRRLDPPELSG